MKQDWQAIGRKLPLLTVALTMVAVVAVASVAYRQMRDALVRSASDRITGVSKQVAGAMTASYAQAGRVGTPLSRDTAVRRALEAPSPATRDAAQRRIAADRAADSLAKVIELLDATGHRVAGVGDDVEFAQPAAALDRAHGYVIHPLTARGDTVLTDAQVAVLDASGDPIGSIRKLSRVSSGQSRQLLTGLIGNEARLLIGNVNDGVWTDLNRRVAAPPFNDAGTSTPTVLSRDFIGAGAKIGGTPLAVWVELSENVVLRPARRFLLQIVVVAAIVIALAALGAWQLSRHVIAPVAELTRAAERLANGDHGVRATVRRQDEVGRLAKAFNVMAESIEISTHELEQQGLELEMQQRELEESNEELRNSLEETTLARHAAETALHERSQLEEQLHQSQKMEAVGRLAGGIAHDFNNILTVIISYSDLVLSGDTIDEATRGDLRQIREAAGRAAGLTKQLLAFSRKQVLHPAALDVNEVVSEVFGMLARVIPSSITVRTELDPSVGSIYADRGQIGQVIMNLATNARDAMPEGGTLSIETSSAVLDDAYLTMHPTGRAGPHVILTVRDTGIGMDAETQARVFEPFFTTKDAGKGTGLGLATVYGIVQQSGGSVYVYSEPGRGTTFKLYFPLHDSAPDARAEPTLDLQPVRPLRVLMAEDDPLVRDAIAVVMRRLGHTVTCCDDAVTAIDRLERDGADFDLVLSDVVMPGKSGLDLAETVRRDHPQLPIVLVSGYSEETVSGGRSIPSDIPFVEKPFTADDIAKAIATAVRMHSARAPEPVV